MCRHALVVRLGARDTPPMRTLSILTALLLANEAAAFCGTYVSSYEETPENSASEVAIVRSANTTTLTVSNDVVGDTRDFAMVIPVPEVLPEDAIHVVDPTVFDRLRGYSNPRQVSYECGDFVEEGDTDTDADTDTDTDVDTGSTVDVEAQYIVGEYDVSILSAEQSGGLVTWLQSNGYNVPDSSAELLGEYIDAGSYFFAAQVREDAGIESGQMLSPLQFRYTSLAFSLPIRIGTLNSPGAQDLRIYAFTDYDQGSVGIANYDEERIDTDCMWQPDEGETLTSWYDDRLDEAYGNVDGAAWVTEYSWGNGNCDPCTGVIPSDDDVYTLGYQDDYHYGAYYWFTRLNMRYTPETATQDLVLYESRLNESRQMRFIDYAYELEGYFPICGSGWASDPGECFPEGDVDTDTDALDGDDEAAACGCASGGSTALWLGLGALAAVRRRRARAV